MLSIDMSLVMLVITLLSSQDYQLRSETFRVVPRVTWQSWSSSIAVAVIVPERCVGFSGSHAFPLRAGALSLYKLLSQARRWRIRWCWP